PRGLYQRPLGRRCGGDDAAGPAGRERQRVPLRGQHPPARGPGLLPAIRHHRHRPDRRDDRCPRGRAGRAGLPRMGRARGPRREGRAPRYRDPARLQRLPHSRRGDGAMSPTHRRSAASRHDAASGRRAGSRPGAAVLGVVGELLLTAGVLVLLFLVWQLWWTDVVADREQSGIIDGLEQEWGTVDEEQIAPRQDGPPPVPDAPEEGKVWATMHVPAFDRPRFPLAEGVDLESVLNVKGAGHYPETALPGEVGNAAIAGHRNTYGRVFE